MFVEVRSKLAGLASLLICAALLTGCEGDTGDPGPQGPAGPPGAPGDPGTPGTPGAGTGVPIDTVDADNSESINATISSVEVPAGGGAPVVTFTLKNSLNQGLSGLQAGNIRFTLGQLRPEMGGGSTEWVSYITRLDNGVVQGTTETAAPARFSEIAAGTYRYTFAQAMTAYTGATFDPALRHRIGFEVRGFAPVNNATCDFLPSAGTSSCVTPDGDPVPPSTDLMGAAMREIVDNDTCTNCHDLIEFHGGARFDQQYCVACHNPQTVDGQAPNASLDHKVMIHKIHAASLLSSPYVITGFGGTVYAYSDGSAGTDDIQYTQDVRNCQTCHQEDDEDTPQASNWQNVATIAACGSCHDDLVSNPVNPGAGTMTHPGGIVFSDSTQCLDCHGPNSNVTNTAGEPVQIAVAHTIPLDVQSAKFEYQVVSVTDASGGAVDSGDVPRVTIRVVDPTNNNTPYDIQAAGNPFLQSSAALRVDLAWTGYEFSNALNPANTPSAAPYQPMQITFASGTSPAAGVTNNGDGTFTANAPFALPVKSNMFPAGSSPLLESGGLVALLEGRPRVDTNGDGVADASAQVEGRGIVVPWDGDGTGRLERVDINRCNQCHEVLSLHGGNRTDNIQLCGTCHNPNATDIRQRAAGACNALTTNATQAPMTGTNPDVSIDFRFMIHSIHAGAITDYVVCGNGNSVHDYSEVVYPGDLNNCEGCHLPPTSTNPSYYGRDPSTILSVSVDANAVRESFADDLALSPTTTACAGCHVDNTALTHMRQNGGVIGANAVAGNKTDTGQGAGNNDETCALCHGPGRTADIREVHGLRRYEAANNPN